MEYIIQASTLDDIAVDARILSDITLKCSDKELIRSKYAILQQKVSKLHEAALSAKGIGGLQESGNDGCGDYYTEFIILLQDALSPIRCEIVKNKLSEIIKNN